MTRVLAMERAPRGILVNCVAPGPIRVARTVHGPKQEAAFLGRMALKRYGTPDGVDDGFRAAGVLYDPSEGA